MKKTFANIFSSFFSPTKKKVNDDRLNKCLSSSQLSRVDPLCLPHHVAFIPDGNRRWNKKQNLLSLQPHFRGKDTLKNIVKAGQEIGIPVLTFYIFSTENWERPKEETDNLMKLLKKALLEEKEMMIKEEIKFSAIGDFKPLPQDVSDTLKEIERETSFCQKTEVVFAINYGSRSEICRVFQKLLDKNVEKQTVTEELIAKNLDTAKWSYPDLLIRTGGEKRLSNFLLWQLSYTELYYTEIPWPEFTPDHFLKAILDFQKRERRLGGY